MKRSQLNKSEIKELISKVEVLYNSSEIISKKDAVEIIDNEIIYVNKEPRFFLYSNTPVPTIKFLLTHQILKMVVVDMGAVKFVAGGADVMRPGIVSFDESIKKDDFVAVVDVTNKKPLSVCIALFSSEDLKNIMTGKVLKNIHYVGDKIWNISH